MIKKSQLKIVFTADQIDQTIRQYAQKLLKLYLHKPLVIIGILNGCIYFATQLTQYLSSKMDLQLEFFKFHSYNQNQKLSASQILFYQPKINLHGKHLLILDDILDTGGTLKAIHEYVQKFHPLSVRYGVLVKTELGNISPLTLNNTEIDGLLAWHKTSTRDWLIGFGLDLSEFGRHLPEIYSIKTA